MQTEKPQEFIRKFPSVNKWLLGCPSERTRNVYVYNLMVFCKWCNRNPEELLRIWGKANGDLPAIRKEFDLSEVVTGNDTGGYVILDLLQKFLMQGELPDARSFMQGRTIKVGTLAYKTKQSIQASIKSFFAHNRAQLPKDPNFKISRDGRDRTHDVLTLDEAKMIIAACKSPYRELYLASLYSGMGRGELLLLGKMWSRIREQVLAGEDPIKIEFNHRKSNPTPYFTFVPRKVFEPFKDSVDSPFVKPYDGKLVPINENNTASIWKFARRRLGNQIKKQAVSHDLRDFLSTRSTGFMDENAVEFLLGHQVDSNEYKKLYYREEFVRSEWAKWKKYVDMGVTSEQEGRVLELERKVGELTEQLEATGFDKKSTAEIKRLRQKALEATASDPKVLKAVAEAVARQYGPEFTEFLKQKRASDKESK